MKFGFIGVKALHEASKALMAAELKSVYFMVDENEGYFFDK